MGLLHANLDLHFRRSLDCQRGVDPEKGRWCGIYPSLLYDSAFLAFARLLVIQKRNGCKGIRGAFGARKTYEPVRLRSHESRENTHHLATPCLPCFSGGWFLSIQSRRWYVLHIGTFASFLTVDVLLGETNQGKLCTVFGNSAVWSSSQRATCNHGVCCGWWRLLFCAQGLFILHAGLAAPCPSSCAGTKRPHIVIATLQAYERYNVSAVTRQLFVPLPLSLSIPRVCFAVTSVVIRR